MSTEQPTKTPEVPRQTLKRMFKVYGTILNMAWVAAKSRSILLLACMVILGVSGAIRSLISKFVIDALKIHHFHAAVVAAIAFLVAMGLATIVQDLLGLMQFDMGDRISQEVDRRIMSIVMGVPGLDHLERPEFADKIKLVRDQSYVPFSALANVNALAYMVFGLVAALILLGSIHPLLLLMPVVAVPSSLLQFKTLRKHFAKFDETAPEDRLASHYMQLLTEDKSAKEVRLFGLRNLLVGRHKELTDRYIKKLYADRLKRSAVGVASGALYGATLAASIGFIGWLALRGKATFGEVVMGVAVARMVIGHVEMAASMFAWLAELSLVGERYLWMLEYEPDVQIREKVYPAPERIVRGITFDNVSFTYPGTDKTVLKGVSFFILAGSTVALVGENGAGKTSLVKLLCRFYDPTEGRIMVDDMDLRDLDLEDWRNRTGAGFQDFVRFQLLAREAVGVGDLGAIEDGAAVATAARMAGALSVINKLPHGADTQLGREFEDGVDLSEGEWQRVALARGAMRPTPILVVLDEPTASLDARAEHDVFERFAEMAAGRGANDPITLLVSHRFSTVRMAELIVVLNEGEIEQIGTHDELMAADARYAELFRLQASRYD
ncbi:MAG: ABC transporter ATP-binding protein [Actinomycetota bacterium]|nr:ABC transporter ATP-binding protein/permease [Actinomycetota bacterium]